MKLINYSHNKVKFFILFSVNPCRYYNSVSDLLVSWDSIKLAGNNRNFIVYTHDSKTWVDPFRLDILSGTTWGDILEPISKPTKFKYAGARIYEITKKVEIDGAKFKSEYNYLHKPPVYHVETFSKNHKAKEVLI